MTVRPILTWPDTRLTQACAAVADTRQDELIQDLFDTMYDAAGRGLAAPQIGVMKRIFVMDCTWKEAEPSPMVMINPTIMAVEQQLEVMEEGCLSLPGIAVRVARPVAVTVQWTGAKGDIHMADFDGIQARCIQHEFDHLNGIVTLDHLSDDMRIKTEKTYLEQTT